MKNEIITDDEVKELYNNIKEKEGVKYGTRSYM